MPSSKDALYDDDDDDDYGTIATEGGTHHRTHKFCMCLSEHVFTENLISTNYGNKLPLYCTPQSNPVEYIPQPTTIEEEVATTAASEICENGNMKHRNKTFHLRHHLHSRSNDSVCLDFISNKFRMVHANQFSHSVFDVMHLVKHARVYF